jgi:ribonuclease T2
MVSLRRSFFPLRLPAALALALILAPFSQSRAAPAEGCVLDKCAGGTAPAEAYPDQASPNQAAPEDPNDAGPAPTPLEPRRAPIGGAARAAGDFDFYVLALSWSPGFCRTPGAVRARGQCDPGAGLGFVVHGLWPQNEHGYPQDCLFGARTPSRIALQAAAGLYPSEGLERYEWRRHGVCAGKSPTDYFTDVRRAHDAIVIPPSLQSARADQSWTSIDIERAFIAANARLRPGMIGVACARGVLQEVRICFSRDLREFHACPEVARRGCPIGPVSVPPAL